MKNLRKVFDYQRWEENDRLAEMIRATESRYMSASRQEIDEEDLFMVNAAGSAEASMKKDKFGRLEKD